MADQRIILISWHATLSPFTGRFILSLSPYLSFFLFYRLYPLLRYSLSLYVASSSFLSFAGYSSRRNRESFLPSQLPRPRSPRVILSSAVFLPRIARTHSHVHICTSFDVVVADLCPIARFLSLSFPRDELSSFTGISSTLFLHPRLPSVQRNSSRD